MTVALALTVVAASALFVAEDTQTIKPLPVAVVCTKTAEHSSSGLTKICYYRCTWFGAREGTNASAMTAKPYEHCPQLVPRWRLNHNRHFGPSADAR